MTTNLSSDLPIQIHVVEASAGSGKTYALARRYLHLLLSSGSVNENVLRHILAVTFTNKAAIEMKERILRLLKRMALKDLSPDEGRELLEPMRLSSDQASARAFLMLDDLLRHYNFFQVQTIDSFINAILSGCAFKLNFSANFKIHRNSREYLLLSLDRLIDRALTQPVVADVFRDFLQQYLFLENRTSWFPKKDILDLLKTLFEQRNRYGGQFVVTASSVRELIVLKKAILKNMRALFYLLPEATDKKFRDGLEKFLKKHPDGFDMDAVSDYFVRSECPVHKKAAVPDGLLALWQDIRRQLKDLAEAEAWGVFQPYIAIFHLVLEELGIMAAREDIVFLEELNRLAAQLLYDEVFNVGELYYRLATTLRHFLIDEFQDTSRLQWQNLRPLVEEALGSGGTLFYVGDKKQAIYGFRGGDAALFDEIQNAFPAFPIATTLLEKNWRSQKAVVEFNNFLFGADNLSRFLNRKAEADEKARKKEVVFLSEEAQADILDNFHGYHQNWREDKPNGYVHWEFLEAENKEASDALLRPRLLELMVRLRERFSLPAIAVLLRDNADVEKVTAWLLEASLPVVSERSSNIQENFLVKEMIAFFRFLQSPIDNLAFASFILGEAFSAATGLAMADLRHFVFRLNLRKSRQRDIYLYKEFRRQYPAVWDEYLEPFFESVGLFPLYEVAVTFLRRFQVLEFFPEYQGFVMRFLELMKKKEPEAPDLASFLDFFDQEGTEEFYANTSVVDAIHVLTIHKAKGLEFPVVILPSLEIDVQVGSSGEIGQASFVLRPQESELHLMKLKKKYTAFSERLAAMYAQEYKASLVSALNNAYVALTRAQEEMYIFVPKKAGSASNLARFLFPDPSGQVGLRPLGSLAVLAPDPKILRLPPAQYRDWINFLSEEWPNPQKLKNPEAARFGEVRHFILSEIDNLSLENARDSLDRALAKAKVRFSEILDWEAVRADVFDILREEHFRDFFFVGAAQVKTEVDVSTPAGSLRRMDRVIIHAQEVWIVDYKNAKPEGRSFLPQLSEYVALLKPIFPQHKVRGFFLYLAAKAVEEIFS